MKKSSLVLYGLFILILLLVSCSDPEPTPFPVTETAVTAADPTDIPATKSPLEGIPTQMPPTELPATMTPQPTLIPIPTATPAFTADPLLTNKSWQWIRRDPNGSQMDAIFVPNPEAYTLFFHDDGTLQAKLDCNERNGRFTTSNPGSIFMELDTTTLVLCGETSLGEPLAMMFGPAQSYHFAVNKNVLALAWMAGGPIDYFRRADAATLPADMINKTWQWTALNSTVLAVDNSEPEKYLLQFNEDGTAAIQADCNLVEAAYTSAGSSLTIHLNPPLAPATLADCPDAPLGEFYLLSLASVQDFTMQDERLMLLVGGVDGGAGTMYFSEIGAELPAVEAESSAGTATPPAPATDDGTGTVNAPDGINMRVGPGTIYPVVGIIADDTVLSIVGVSQDREWWVVENPETPEEQVWVSRNFVQTNTTTRDVPTVADPEIEPTLLDNPWQWLSLTTPTETTAVSDPTLYTIQFNADGTAALRADCNSLTASYTTAENAINISTGATTLVACPGDSLDALYLDNLTQVSTYFFEAGGLYLELPAAGGTMRFASTTPPAPPTPAETTTAAAVTPTPPAAEGDFFKVTSFGAVGSEQNILTGTEITAVFTETTITGNAGCNEYTGTLTRTAETFTISNLSVTEKACAEPAGIMEQEQAYLTALANVVAFSWEEQLSADGNSVITVGQLFYVTGANGIINLVTP